MNSVRFSGVFTFPKLSPDDQEVVTKIAQKQMKHYVDKYVGSSGKQPSLLEWHEGDSFIIETTRPHKFLGLFKVSGKPDFLDYWIKKGLSEENQVRRQAIEIENEAAEAENRPAEALPAEIDYQHQYKAYKPQQPKPEAPIDLGSR